MTGWTQFTARFDEPRQADAIVEDANVSPNQITYAESHGDIARIRILGYGKHDEAVTMLDAAGGLVCALVADFNDTSDSGTVTYYENFGGQMHESSEFFCPEAQRYSFEISVGGITETGNRAGSDFQLEDRY